MKSIKFFSDILVVIWTDGSESVIKYTDLRKICPCAFCSGEKDVLGNKYGGFSNIDYSTPFTAATIWSAGGLSFTLEAMTTIQEFTRQPWLDPFALVLAGTGTLSDGIETTTGYWNMSVNTAGNSFSWSSSADVNDSDIPEPASMSLLALGLLGFHVRRKLKK